MLRWFRHYAGLARDEKLIGAALRSGQAIERVVWLWCSILESAAAINDGGRYELDLDECAYFLRPCAAGELALIIAALEAGGRIADGRVVHWHERQCPSDRSAERTAAWRERHKPAGGKLNGKVTSPPRHRDALESESESEKDSENNGHVTSHAPELRPEHIVTEWNRLAKVIGKPLVRDLTDSRRQLLKARIRQYSLDDVIAATDKIERSAFLRGDTGWHGCTFDWVFKRANFQKIIEGNYDQ